MPTGLERGGWFGAPLGGIGNATSAFGNLATPDPGPYHGVSCAPEYPLPDLLARLQAVLADRYTIERELGRGGMATVFLAQDRKHHRAVAIKVLRPELAAALGTERFLNEIQIAARLNHPHILPLHDSGEADGFLYYVMPFVEGESLRSRFQRERQLALEDALQITREVAEALSYAHSHDVVHRDIKPENILLSGGHAIVADFGIARAITAAGADRITATGVAVGTPAYMSPEQASAAAQLDGRSDIYALGCVLYEMLAGDPPFTGLSAQAVLARHTLDPVPPLRTVRPIVPVAVEQAVLKALAKVPADRFATATQLAEALANPQAVRGRPAVRRFAILAFAGLVVALSFRAWRSRGTAGAKAAPAVAVLPLANLSGDQSNDYFGEGLAEEITDALGKAGLHVIGRGSARSLVAKGLDGRDIARQLGVGALLQGSVQRAEQQIRITVSLISATDGALLWSETYDRQLRDVFAVQDDIARSVANALRFRLAGGALQRLVRTETSDPEAHALYLQGLYLWNRRTPREVRQAIELFEQAVRRDLQYARAYGGIAMGYTVLSDYNEGSINETTGKALEAARRALQLDSTLAEAYAVIGIVKTRQWRYDEAERAFARAISLDSNLAVAHYWHSFRLLCVGRFDDAIREQARALALEPTALTYSLELAWYVARRYAEEEGRARHTLTLDPRFQPAVYFLSRTLVEEGRADSAIVMLQSILNVDGLPHSEKAAFLAYAYARAGRTAEARRAIAALIGDGQLPARGSVALALDALGERPRALEVLERAVKQSDLYLIFLSRSAPYDHLRADRRAAALLAKIETP